MLHISIIFCIFAIVMEVTNNLIINMLNTHNAMNKIENSEPTRLFQNFPHIRSNFIRKNCTYFPKKFVSLHGDSEKSRP